MDFHESGNSAAYRTFGWSGQEDTHVWATGARSGLSLPPPVEIRPLLLNIDFDICNIDSLLPAALIRVYANDVLIGRGRTTGRSRLQCMIPQEVLQPGAPIELRFEHPCFLRPDFTGLRTDDRVLALCFFSVSMYPPWLHDEVTQLLPHFQGQQVINCIPVNSPPNRQQDDLTVYQFGKQDAARLNPDEGWRFDADGNAWAASRECHVSLPAPKLPGTYLARFDLVPLAIRTKLPTQRITIVLGGAVIGQFKTGIEISLSIPLPSELVDIGGVLRFSFILPDGVPMHELDPTVEPHFLSFVLDSIAIDSIPDLHGTLGQLRCDDVMPPVPISVSERFLDESLEDLPRVIKESIGVELSEIMRLFESLGDNCAFGLAQRKAGSEPLGLLRFANSPLKRLMKAMEDDFKGVSDKAGLNMRWVASDPGEFIVTTDAYQLRWHTNVFDAAADVAGLFEQQAMRLSYLRRKFYEGLKAGRKIFTISRADPLKHPIPLPCADELKYWEEKPEPLRLAELFPLFFKLNRHAANTLLFLTPCERGRRSGTVELLAPGLMRGYVEDFVISQDPKIQDHSAWARVAVNAALLDKGPNASFRKRPTA